MAKQRQLKAVGSYNTLSSRLFNITQSIYESDGQRRKETWHWIFTTLSKAWANDRQIVRTDQERKLLASMLLAVFKDAIANDKGEYRAPLEENQNAE